MKHKENLYATLKKRSEDMRDFEPAPKDVAGAFIPQVVASKPILDDDPILGRSWDNTKMLREALKIWHRFAWCDVIRVAEELGGYETIILALEKNQKQGVIDAAKEFRKELGLTGNDMHDMRVISCAGTIGVGFEIDAGIEHTDEREVGMKYWCPMVQGIRDLGYEDSPMIKDFHLWCDCYDNFELSATNPDMCYTHTHCLASRDDSYCRYCVDFRSKNPDENYYEWLARMWKTKRDEADEQAGGDITAIDRPGFGGSSQISKIYGDLTLEEQLKIGLRTQRRIAIASIVTGAELIGWDKFINGMQDKEIPRLREIMRDFGQRWNVTGTTACDGAVLMNIGMLGSGFDDYRFTSWTKDRAEGYGTVCPIIQSAKESGLEDKLEDIHLWCSAWHTANASCMNDDITCTFTHCMAKGDNCCRWIVENSAQTNR